jgi:hypothetical protein
LKRLGSNRPDFKPNADQDWDDFLRQKRDVKLKSRFKRMLKAKKRFGDKHRQTTEACQMVADFKSAKPSMFGFPFGFPNQNTVTMLRVAHLFADASACPTIDDADSDEEEMLAAKSLRIGDVSGDHGSLSPVTGVMKASQLSLVEAAALTGVLGIAAMVYMAAERGSVLARDDPHGLTPDEAGALTLFTMEGNLYPSMNRLLRERNRTVLTPFFPYMRLMLNARHKLPAFRGNVWRGVAGKDLRSEFVKGQEMYWWSFSSTSKQVSTLHNPMFLGETGVRTQFLIEVLHGVDIERYSIYQGVCEDVISTHNDVTYIA